MERKIDFQEFVDEFDSGFITLDQNLRVLYCNRWIYEKSGKKPDQVINEKIDDIFPQLENSRFIFSCQDAIKLKLPTRLSNSFNPSPLPLYQSQHLGNELYRLQQTTIIKPGKNKGNYSTCEISIQDVTSIVSKESLLKRMAADHEKSALQHKEEKDHLFRIINNTADAIITFGSEYNIQMCNQTGMDIFGYTHDELTNLHFEDLLQDPLQASKHNSDRLKSLLNSAINNGVTSHHSISTYAYKKDGREFPIQIKFSRTSISNKSLIVAILRDISEQVRKDKILNESEARFRNIAKIAPVGIFQTDINGVLNYTNQRWNAITGQSKDIINKDLWFEHITGSNRKEIENKWEAETAHNDQFVIEYSFICNNSEKWVLCQLMEELDDDLNILGYVGSITDISEQRKNQKKIEQLAFYDPLTSLANRRLFKDRLSRSISTSVRDNKKMALLSLDLDEFKRINDSLGHDSGDQLLSTIATRLTKVVREVDTVARLGGDEFSIILNDISRDSDAAIVAQKIINSVSQPIILGNKSINITVSIGITISPDDGSDPIKLVKNADMAMYSVKEVNKNSFNFFNSAMNKKSMDRLSFENDIRNAIENKEFHVNFQPKLNIDTGEVIGVEALARWKHEQRGDVSPASFIPAAESSNLILSLGELMLVESCREIKKLSSILSGSDTFSLAINISTKQLMDENLINNIKFAIKIADIQPSQLELEITESALMQDIGKAIDILNSLKSLGIKIAIDDFGTGYSSLSYLKLLPVDHLKIDQTFISDLMDNQRDKELVTAIIAMAHSLKMKVIAEGIETRDQWELLKTLNCDFGQGYYFSKATDIQELLEYCEKNTHGILSNDSSTGNLQAKR